MNVATYFGAGLYAAGAVFTFRLAAGKVAWAWDNYPDGADVAGAFFVGVFSGLLWPVALTVFGIKELARAHGSSFHELLAERVYRVPGDQRDRTHRAQRKALR